MTSKNKIHVYLNLRDPQDIEEAMNPISEMIQKFENKHGQAKIILEIQASQEPDEFFEDDE